MPGSEGWKFYLTIQRRHRSLANVFIRFRRTPRCIDGQSGIPEHLTEFTFPTWVWVFPIACPDSELMKPAAEKLGLMKGSRPRDLLEYLEEAW